MFHLLRQNQHPQEVSQLAGQRVQFTQLKTFLVGTKAVALRTCPVDGFLAVLDPVLRRRVLITEISHVLGGPRQISHDDSARRC